MPDIWNDMNDIINTYNEWRAFKEKSDNVAEAENALIEPPNAEKDRQEVAKEAARWKDFSPETQKKNIIKMLDEKKKSADISPEERQEMHFISETLKRGWLISDIEMLRDLYGVVTRNRPQESDLAKALKEGADAMLSDLTSRDVHTVPGRSNACDIIGKRIQHVTNESFPPKYCGKKKPFMTSPGKIEQIPQFAKDYFVDQLRNKPLYPEEYPADKNFNRYLDAKLKVHGKKGLTCSELSKPGNGEHLLNVLEEQKSGMGFYVPKLKTKEQIEHERNAAQPTGYWRTNVIGVKKSASAAVKEVLGESVYDDIDEKNLGKMSHRIPLHKNNGTKVAKQGNDVVLMEFGGAIEMGEYKPSQDRATARDKNLPENKYDEKYGKRAIGPDGRPYEHIRKRTKTITDKNGEQVKKDRYIFPGTIAGGTALTLYGTLNVGEYSIESSRKHARNLMARELSDKIDAWLAYKKDPNNKPEPKIKPTMLDTFGYSRGGVTAGQTPKQVNNWISEYMKEQGADDDQILEFKQRFVKYQPLIVDAVPGFGTYEHMMTCNLRGIPNMNAVVRCSFGINQPDLMCSMQQIKGARKLIFSVSDHTSIISDHLNTMHDNTEGEDLKYHRRPFFNAETGEMFQMNSLHDMPDGVYFEDEHMNVIRVNSYSQIAEMFRSVYDGSSPQASREKGIHSMARDWFLENELQSSFPDEITHRMEQAKFFKRAEKLLQNDSKRLNPVKDALRNLNALYKKQAQPLGAPPSLEELSDAHKTLIEQCRKYLKDTGMPPRGKSAEKAGLVGDILSFSMRKKNYLHKKIREKDPDIAHDYVLSKKYKYDPEMDNKIREYNERLEQKPGYLERKVAAEEERIKSLDKIRKTMSTLKQLCNTTLGELDQTRVGKSNSDPYKAMHSMLVKGTQLSEETSMNEFAEFCKDLKAAADDYSFTHDVLFGPMTKDGKLRLHKSRVAAVGAQFFLDEAEKTWKEMQGGVNDRDLPVVNGMHFRKKKVDAMKKNIIDYNAEINNEMFEEDILINGSQKDQKQNASENNEPAEAKKKPDGAEKKPDGAEKKPDETKENPDEAKKNPTETKKKPAAAPGMK